MDGWMDTNGRASPTVERPQEFVTQATIILLIVALALELYSKKIESIKNIVFDRGSIILLQIHIVYSLVLC